MIMFSAEISLLFPDVLSRLDANSPFSLVDYNFCSLVSGLIG